jgi:small subunit ribosomal protein S20
VPRIKSAKKRLRQARRRAKLNRSQRSAIKTAVKKARSALTKEAAAEAIRALDRGARKGLIHRNTAARKKSRLARQLARQAAGS